MRTKSLKIRTLPLIISVVSCSLVIFLTACISSSGSTETDLKNQLLKRVNKEWNYKIAQQWKGIYDLTTEEYRKTHDRESFGLKSNANITQYTIEEVILSENMKKATVTVSFKVMHQGVEFPFTFDETWIREKGTWWLVIKKPGNTSG